MKKWFIKILKKILKKLEPNVFEEIVITHSYKPLITITANYSLSKWDEKRVPKDRIKEILAKRLSEQIVDHMDILTSVDYCSPFAEEQIHYKATIQIADNRN